MVWLATHDAIFKGDLSALCRLLDQDPSLLDRGNAFNHTPLMLAAGEDYEVFVKELLARGAAVNLLDDNHRSALYAACLANAPRIVSLLLAHGACPFQTSRQEGYGVLFLAVHHAHLGVVQALLAHPEKHRLLAQQDRGGLTPLHIACALGNLPLIKLLLAAGAAEATQYALAYDKEERAVPAPLECALNKGDVEVAEVLEEPDRLAWLAKAHVLGGGENASCCISSVLI